MTSYRIFILIILAAAAPIDGFSNTKLTAEAFKVGVLAVNMGLYEAIQDGKHLASWADYAAHVGDMRSLDAPLPSGEVFSEVYSLIPEDEGQKFPLGLLLCIRFKSTDWPESWLGDAPTTNQPEYTDQQKAAVNAQIAWARPIRYLVYKTKSGAIIHEWWYEDVVQAMLKKTGLIIPPPTPYKQPIPSVRPDAAPRTVLASATAIPNSLPPMSTATTVTKPQPLAIWWGAVILVVVVILFSIREKKMRN